MIGFGLIDLDTLNAPQREAVEYGEGPLLVLAGAGSGKTRVLAHRIAYLIYHYHVDPLEIFAVTFTNKAAGEMRKRVCRLLNRAENNYSRESDLWVNTFHSACVRILRSDIHHLGYQNQFTIYDDSDQLSAIKACMRELNISESALSPKVIQGRINQLKNEGIDERKYQPKFGGPIEDAFHRAFLKYGESLKRAAALDFADLILMTVRLFKECPKKLEDYQKRFRFILVDEYQDTNRCQYELMKSLAGQRANLCAVGDEDQSIYKWRGADIRNILNFEKDFPNTKIIKLEENYRSTKNIIEAASHVISFNSERREKKLWSSKEAGEKIVVLESYDEHDEAIKVVNQISEALAKGYPHNEIAVFYRTNAQSRVLEDMLRAKNIHYQIFGGLKFYDRLEVKDTLAYLRLIANPHDNVSFRRIINVPTRGIGAVSLERFSKRASETGLSHYQFLSEIFKPDGLEASFDLGRSRKNFEKFYSIMESLRASKSSVLPSDLVNLVLEETEYRESLIREKTLEAQSRLENLAELRQSIGEFELRSAAEDPNRTLTLESFLEQISLVSDFDRSDPHAPMIKLMTVHMAKGLEFDVVLIVGLEEELFPSIRKWEEEDPLDIEEERRLFYVAMTRAKEKLFLLFAKNRTVFGTEHYRVKSRFIEEVPDHFVDFQKADYFSRRKPYASPPQPSETENETFDDFSQIAPPDEMDMLRTGTRVSHPTFGEGIVRQKLSEDKFMVEFRGRGIKTISLKFAQLKSV